MRKIDCSIQRCLYMSSFTAIIKTSVKPLCNAISAVRNQPMYNYFQICLWFVYRRLFLDF